MSIAGRLPALLGGKPAFEAGRFPMDGTSMSESCIAAVVETMRSGWHSMFTSPEVERFETEFAAFVGARHAVLVNSCTSAITCSLIAAGVSSGDVVALPAYTYIGSCMPVIGLGAKPLFVDVDASTGLLDVDSLRNALTRHSVKAVIHPHLFGTAQNTAKVAELAANYGACYVADSAQFLGQRHATQLMAECGSACFSFGESKLLRVGEGGAVATNSDSVAERLRMARHEGEQWTRLGASRLTTNLPTPRDVLSGLASVQAGFNFRPPAIVAALARVKLRELPELLDQTRTRAEAYGEVLESQAVLSLPRGEKRTWWTYPVRVEEPSVRRDVLLAAALAEGMPIGVHFPRLLHEHPIVSRTDPIIAGALEGARSFSENHLVLPLYEALPVGDVRDIAMALAQLLVSVDNLRTDNAVDVARDLLQNRSVESLASGLFFFLQPKDHDSRVHVRPPVR